ncbi:cbb3-type cytochrome c oxidase subunit 3 [Alcanivorax sp. 1008]|uniref:cbb3-type cytochrome oxidase subunit 3 n=1 Tax=Alcanivorax sp. 1008 TaxID=2816853 RepID=UPI001DF247C9|nr:cbb3-type cytochrome c oxidase subunit 3 [Alcanivorax sp. 1008]MCC1497760.1 cbb3-type cytochrome c oxidase subunit 3 [Alcanivorax sp. 1008]
MMDVITFQTGFTLIFFLAFMTMVIWVFWPGRKSRYDAAADLPFVADKNEFGRESQRHD